MNFMRTFPTLVRAWFVVWVTTTSTARASSSSSSAAVPIVVGVDGGTESIRACCFDARNGEVVGRPCAVPYPTQRPHPGWAEQRPSDWWENLGRAVRGAVTSLASAEPHHDVLSLCLDTTCCSVVALDEDGAALRPCLLWMDARAADEAASVLERARGDPHLSINSGGRGPLSAEWLLPKALWLRRHEPDVWRRAVHVCEYQDYLNHRLTGVMCASSMTAAVRWHWHGVEALGVDTEEGGGGDRGRPMSLYRTMGVPELADKLPSLCVAPGDLVGGLTPEAARHLHLRPGLPVAQGGPDAFVGMLGMGCVKPGQVCLMTGSSHLHCRVVAVDDDTSSSSSSKHRNYWGPYPGAPLPHLRFVEGGQSSTGSVLKWFQHEFCPTLSYADLDQLASRVPPGADGLLALETFQGARTPLTDPRARGALLGLTLSHTKAHVWRALCEAVCLGTRACLEGMGGDDDDHNITVSGGATRSGFWTQMHADVTGKPIVVTEQGDAPLLGCAVLASVVAGVHPNVEEAVRRMVRIRKVVRPDPEAHRKYDELYRRSYQKLAPSVRDVVHSLRGGGGGEVGDNHDTMVSPSLLAADWTDLRSEIRRCVRDAGVRRLHVDVFDGVFLDSPHALTFGPQMVRAMRRCCDEMVTSPPPPQPSVSLDVHLCVERPARYVDALRRAGASEVIFQFEALDTMDERRDLIRAVHAAGMRCGVSLNPATPVEDLYPLLWTTTTTSGHDDHLDSVTVLAVEPGFGGQRFRAPVVWDKVRQLVTWRAERCLFTNQGGVTPRPRLVVDGGIDPHTAVVAAEAGADVLVAGTFLFRHAEGMKVGVNELRESMRKGWGRRRKSSSGEGEFREKKEGTMGKAAFLS